jgi:23S rRNA (guanosine2251-2'-O)-methyltransferase
MILEGGLSVKAAILAGNRTVHTVYIDRTKHDKDTSFILHRCEDQNIEVKRPDRAEIDAMAQGRTHGGVLAEAEGRRFQTLEDCLQGDKTFLVLLEGVEDPFNLGYVMRSLYCAGCTGLILRSRSWENSEGTILKSSAGASEYLPTVMSDDPASLVVKCRGIKIHCYAAMRKDAKPYYEADYTGPFLLAIGGEMRGLSASVLEACQENLYIPYARQFRGALNAAGASAAFGFEAMRQRMTLDQ